MDNLISFICTLGSMTHTNYENNYMYKALLSQTLQTSTQAYLNPFKKQARLKLLVIPLP